GTAILYPELSRVRTVQTIHNLAYQGRFWAADWHLLNLDPRYFVPEFLEFYGFIDFLKGGLVFADAITTVSPRYAEEIQTQQFGEGLDGVLRARTSRLRGILNGIDYRSWNPATDTALPLRYDADHLDGKAVCKAALQGEMGIQRDATAPLLAMITRLAGQKGVDVALTALPALLGESTAQLVVLGSGEPALEAGLRALSARFPGRVGVRLGYDEPLAHRIEAGADVFVMPSRYEPCGLNQMYSLRYGTVPVVHDTGGLHDTVQPVDETHDTGTGFRFSPCTPDALLAALRQAIALHADPVRWRRLMTNGMRQDFSWERSAGEYAALYAALPGMR
ncbi:MAG TPA: glycogen synthase, partial [Candidatus Binatia bacterium]|nr:glycogen synthase [Candidatus Binatia bacterium]